MQQHQIAAQRRQQLKLNSFSGWSLGLIKKNCDDCIEREYTYFVLCELNCVI